MTTVRRAKRLLPSNGNIRRIKSGSTTRFRLSNADLYDINPNEVGNPCANLSAILRPPSFVGTDLTSSVVQSETKGEQSETLAEQTETEETTEGNRVRFTLYSNWPPSKPKTIPDSHCESCYCRESPEPESTVYRNHKQFCDSDEERAPKVHVKRKPGSYCRKLRSLDALNRRLSLEMASKIDYVPNSVFLKRLRERAHQNCPCPCNGPTRTYKPEEYAQTDDTFSRFEEDSSSEEEDVTDGPHETATQMEKCMCCTCQALAQEAKAAELEEIREFRDEQFFETHSTASLNPEADHTCVFRFTVNERMQTVPLQPDELGRCRCAICDKPLQKPVMLPTVARSVQPKKEQSPLQINVKTPPHKTSFRSARKKSPQEQSFALRKQKGVV